MRALRRFISKRLQTADRWLDNRAQNTILLVSLGLALLIGFVDIHGNSNLLIVYVLPMALGAWYGGRRVGVVLAIYCSAEWFVAASLTTGTPAFSLDALITFLVRLAIFLVLTSALARQRESARQQKLLTEFIVHDLRSPISSAITGLQTLQLSADHLAPEDAEMVSLSLISNQRALALVNSMLDVSKLESGSMDLHIEEVFVERMVMDCFAQLELWARGSQVELVADVHVKTIECDPILTTRVIVNLLSNALKFSPPRTQIHVTVGHGPHGTARFSVTDQGPGIPAEYLQSIFEPFGQVKGTKGGTGLGLAFCRLAVNVQGGRIWAESHVGKGTSMRFTLPIHREKSIEPGNGT